MKAIAQAFCALLILTACSEDAIEDPLPTLPSAENELQGPIAKPLDGYGSDGTYTVAKTTFESPIYEGKNVEIFYPQEATEALPTIFYSHPYGGEESEYNIGLYEFIAKKGYAVVFAPYPTTGVSVDERYETLWESFKKAATDYPDIIDTEKVGFMGHSFGGGASFSLAYKGFVEEGWGENGRFIFAMAQWFSYQLSDTQLDNFPSNTKLITQVYDDDVTNDHRMAIDIFKNINIADAEKDFILIKSSVLNDYTYSAEHNLPNTKSAYDAYDYYGIYRLLDAMIDYSFNGNLEGKKVALGNGSLEQISMPSYDGQALEPLVVTDDPTPNYPQSKYLFKCASLKNPRSAHCE
ncbi:alpha/beta hydrolase [Zobellia galactanivorans]|uniref:alpha/beta hydrolase n=1 Tax=Zobellia galactanivorans (strain DSM 12802 / CCUG 47099 / CIP 106680 / NCIMB 13871 / Dsij) TaxID=63186 RepID=UPI001C071860|nr:alpha/beta hydrolase [Zobellia galactanivorans]MBU3024957.1 alpha/beta hydrolase [Zobellia galactanivorans]